MSTAIHAFRFHSRRGASTVVSQRGSGRTTLHLAAASTTGGGAVAALVAARASEGGDSFNSDGDGHGGGGGRFREWWGSVRPLIPSLPGFRDARAAEAGTDAETEAARRERRQQRIRRQQLASRSFFRSPEFFIFVLGFAALLAFIVMLVDAIGRRPFRPMAALVFVASGTYCIALIRQQRLIDSAEQALVIEIMDGSASNSGLRVMSKEDRRALFDYFTFRPSKAAMDAATAAAAAAAAGHGGGGGSGGRAKAGLSPANAAAGDIRDSDLGAAGGPIAEGERAREPLAAQGVADTQYLTTNGAPSRSAGAAAASPQGGGGGGRESGGRMASSAGANEGSVVAAQGGSGGLVAGTSIVDPAEVVFGTSKSASGSVPKTVSGFQGGAVEESKDQETTERESVLKDEGEVECDVWSTDGCCIICFGIYAEGEELCRLPCRHLYHSLCLDAWLDGPNHAWCPLCKSSLLPPESRSSSTSIAINNNPANHNNINSNSSSGGGQGRLPGGGNAAVAAATSGDEAV